jgi:DNA-binding NtrC family response regulator
METVAVTDMVSERNHAIEDETLAARCAATTVLITADSSAAVERLARRIHKASVRGASPFVLVEAATLPVDAAVLTGTCADLLDTVRGGSLLITDVEHMPRIVQERLLDTLGRLQASSEPTCRGRLIAGTSAVLLERIAQDTFSERLFYRLNIIHVVAKTAAGTNVPAAAVV